MPRAAQAAVAATCHPLERWPPRQAILAPLLHPQTTPRAAASASATRGLHPWGPAFPWL